MFYPAIDEVPTSFEVSDDDGLYYVDQLLAGDRRMPEVLIGVRVILDPFEKDGVPFHEFAFAISVFDEERYSTELIFDRAKAKRYLPEEVRALVVPTVCAAMPTLIGHVQPELIFRQTSGANVPKKALCKHQMITDTLLQLEYVINQQDTDDDGFVYWVFQRGTESENGEN